MSIKTFQIILESEMDKARDQKGVTGHEFTKQAHFDRPSSSASNKAVDVRTFWPVTLHFFIRPPPILLPGLGLREWCRAIPHLMQPCCVAMGRFLIWGLTGLVEELCQLGFLYTVGLLL